MAKLQHFVSASESRLATVQGPRGMCLALLSTDLCRCAGPPIFTKPRLISPLLVTALSTDGGGVGNDGD
jgi:hypothetical protein